MTNTNLLALRKFAVFAPLLAVVLAFAACGSNSGSVSIPQSHVNNVVPIVVNAGVNGDYVNGAFASVTVCAPGTANCQTIDNVLVDTGSIGLRLLSTKVTVALSNEQQNGTPIMECNQFVDGFTWGPLAFADIKMAGEVGANVPFQLIDDKNQYPVPTACSNTGTNESTLVALGANGVLGIGEWDQDCGTFCAQQIGAGIFYGCPGGTCSEIRVPIGSQAQNPVFTFRSDNNGTLITLPNVSAPGAATLSGSLIFGIDTQSNNQLTNVGVYGVDNNGNFTTYYNGTPYSSSYLDSGSNAIFFLDPATVGMPACTTATGFYCPASTKTFTATNVGTNLVSSTITFSIDNGETLLNNSSITALPTLGGTNESIMVGGSTIPESFDWGLPFYYGHPIFTAIEGQATTAGYGPFWAY